MPGIVKKYSDFDLSFLPHPVSGDITRITDADAIKRAVRNMLLTNQDERPFNNEYGGNLTALLFEPINPATQEKIKITVLNTIRKFEERIEVLDLVVNIDPDENGYDIKLTFAIDAISEIQTVSVFLERVR
jgi:phage baseplate assembly protein W